MKERVNAVPSFFVSFYWTLEANLDCFTFPYDRGARARSMSFRCRASTTPDSLLASRHLLFLRYCYCMMILGFWVRVCQVNSASQVLGKFNVDSRCSAFTSHGGSRGYSSFDPMSEYTAKRHQNGYRVECVGDVWRLMRTRIYMWYRVNSHSKLNLCARTSHNVLGGYVKKNRRSFVIYTLKLLISSFST